MTGTFACPECGSEVHPKGFSPGRQVRCRDCATLVEVPFLPRALPKRRGRRRRWARERVLVVACAVGFLLVAVAVGGAARWVGNRGAARARAEVVAHVTAMQEAEASGDLERAFDEAEAALRLAAPDGVPGPDDSLRTRRDALARRLARQQLDSLSGQTTDCAIALVLALHDRVQADPALADLGTEIADRLADLGVERAEAALADAESAIEALCPSDAFLALRTAHETTTLFALRGEDDARLMGEIDAVAARLAAGFGVVVEPVRGSFFLGSASEYETGLRQVALQRVEARRFLPQPAEAPWAAIWEQHAVDRLCIEVTEKAISYTTSSSLVASQIELALTWTRAGGHLWQGRATSRTRIPPPTLPAYLATRFATATRRDPSAERRLHEDALDTAMARLAPQFQSLPSPAGMASGGR